MLILNRSKGKKIIIDNEISITVKRIGKTRDKISLQICAPEKYSIKKMNNIYTIGNLITVEVLDISFYGQAVIGITAPKNMPINREEVHLEMEYNNCNEFYNPQLDEIRKMPL